MLQRMSIAIQTRSQQQDAITKIRTQLTRTRELAQREKQRFERETAMIQDTHTKVAAADRQAMQARAKLSQERDRYKKEALLRTQREVCYALESATVAACFSITVAAYCCFLLYHSDCLLFHHYCCLQSKLELEIKRKTREIAALKQRVTKRESEHLPLLIVSFSCSHPLILTVRILSVA